mgnify:FL=1
MKSSKKLRLQGVAWTILGLAFLLLMLFAITAGDLFKAALCLVCFLLFAGANMRAQRLYAVADFISGVEAVKGAVHRVVQAGEDIKKGDPVYMDKGGKARKS